MVPGTTVLGQGNIKQSSVEVCNQILNKDTRQEGM